MSGREPESVREAIAAGGLALLLLQLAASRAGIDDFSARDRASPRHAARSYGATLALVRARG